MYLVNKTIYYIWTTAWLIGYFAKLQQQLCMCMLLVVLFTCEIITTISTTRLSYEGVWRGRGEQHIPGPSPSWICVISRRLPKFPGTTRPHSRLLCWCWAMGEEEFTSDARIDDTFTSELHTGSITSPSAHQAGNAQQHRATATQPNLAHLHTLALPASHVPPRRDLMIIKTPQIAHTLYCTFMPTTLTKATLSCIASSQTLTTQQLISLN